MLVTLCALCACAGFAAAQSPSPSPAIATPAWVAEWVDPNRQVEGFQASLLGIGANPLGLVPAVVQMEGMEVPNGGVTFASQHNAEVSLDAENLWSYEFVGYNGDNFGVATVHNIKDPSWPVVFTLFEGVSSPDFMPIFNGQINKTELDDIAQGLMSADGTELGYIDILDAVNDTALAVVARMAADPTQAIFGILGNDATETILEGGIDMPVDETTVMPLTPEEIAALPDPDSLKSPAPARRMLRKLADWVEAPL